MTGWSGPLGEALAALIDHRGKTPKKLGTDWVDDGVRVLSALHVKGGRLQAEPQRFVPRDVYDRWMPEKLQAGDVLLTSEAPLGEVAYLSESVEACLGQRLFGLRPKPEVLDSRYLFYLLQHSSLRSQLLQRSSGTTVAGIRQAELVRVALELPPLDHQRRVANALGSFDDLLENNRRRIEILEEMARLLYREWFVHFRFPGHEDVEVVDSELGPIPDGWEVVQLRDVVMLSYGKALKADDRNGGPVEVYGSGGVVGHHDTFLTEGPGIVVGRKGNVGALFWSDADFFPIDTTYYVETDLPLHFVYQLLGTLTFIDSHAAVPGLSRDQAYDLRVVVPSAIQAQQYEERVTPNVQLRRNLIEQNRVLREARGLLLPRLVSGELDVSELDLDGVLA